MTTTDSSAPRSSARWLLLAGLLGIAFFAWLEVQAFFLIPQDWDRLLSGRGLLTVAFYLLFLLVGLVVLCTLYVYLRVLRGRKRMLQVSLGLQLGGAIGNLLDRIRIGHVVDFIYIRHWPVFNVADAAIFAGVLVMVYYVSFGAGEPGRPEKQTPAQAEQRAINGN